MTVHAINPDTPTFDFATFWESRYPHPRNRGSKKKAREYFERAGETPENICRAAAMYARWLNEPDQEWLNPKMAQTWLFGEEWEGWLEQADDIERSDLERQKRAFALSEAAAAARAETERKQRELADFQIDFHSDPARRDAWFEQPSPRPGWEEWKQQWAER